MLYQIQGLQIFSQSAAFLFILLIDFVGAKPFHFGCQIHQFFSSLWTVLLVSCLRTLHQALGPEGFFSCKFL